MAFVKIRQRSLPLPLFSFIKGVGSHVAVMDLSAGIRVAVQYLSVLHTALREISRKGSAVAVDAGVRIEQSFRIHRQGQNGQIIIFRLRVVAYEIGLGDGLADLIGGGIVAGCPHDDGFVYRKSRLIVLIGRKIVPVDVTVFFRSALGDPDRLPIDRRSRVRFAAVQRVIYFLSGGGI